MLKKFKNFIKEDATATLGNVSGMGPIVAATPGENPGQTGKSGSGDIGQTMFGTFMKTPAKWSNEKKKKKKKKK
jgi:hypothetical protein